MLQIKVQQQAQSTQQCQFPFSQSQVQLCRHLQPSILNKSSIHSLSLTDKYYQQLPTLASDLQKLDLSRNYLNTLPLGLIHLKQLKINNNFIENIPLQINDMLCLRILRASDNNITILPFLKYVRHLELNRNPIQLITTKLAHTRLQFIQFDWIPFLVNTIFQSSEEDVIYTLCDIIKKTNINSQQQYVGFDLLFQHTKLSPIDIAYPIYKAIANKCDFFIDYLLKYQPNINYNALTYSDKSLLHLALEQNYEKSFQLFKLKKSNISNSSVYLHNLVLCIRYCQIELFTYLIETGLKKYLIQKSEQEIIELLFRYFNQENHNFMEIFYKIFQLLNFSQHNKKIFELPTNRNVCEDQRICQGILYVLTHQQFNKLFDFIPSLNASPQPLLHFAMSIKKSQLVQLLLERYKKPFVRNSLGKLPRTIKGSTFCRKIVWKYQKLCFKQLVNRSPEKYQDNINNSENCKWMNIIYDQLLTSAKYQNSPDNPINQNTNNHHQQLNNTIIQLNKPKSKPKSKQKHKIINQLGFQEINANQLKLRQSLQSSNQQGKTMAIFMQSTLNLQTNKNQKYLSAPLIHSSTTTLCILPLYQAYQKGALNTICKQYHRAPISKPLHLKTSFILSPLRICQDVSSNQSEQQHIFTRQNKKSIQSTCYSPCIDISEGSRVAD